MSNLMNSKDIGRNKGLLGTSKSATTKKLLVEDYKRRLKDNIKSLNENICRILSAAKVFF